MDNLGLAINPLLVVKRADCNSPVIQRRLKFSIWPHQGRPECSGIGGRITSDWVAGIVRNQWPDWSGKRTLRTNRLVLANIDMKSIRVVRPLVRIRTRGP